MQPHLISFLQWVSPILLEVFVTASHQPLSVQILDSLIRGYCGVRKKLLFQIPDGFLTKDPAVRVKQHLHFYSTFVVFYPNISNNRPSGLECLKFVIHFS